MKLTVVNVDEQKLWNGALVRNKRSGKIMEVFCLPKGKTIYQCVKSGEFVLDKHVEYNTVMLNKKFFELVKSEEENG